MITQFYIVEIQQYADGSFGHIVHFAYDENPDTARLKAESKYHEVLAAAAISNLPSHAAIMFNTDGFPILNQCYKHTVVAPVEPEEVIEDPTEEPEIEGVEEPEEEQEEADER